MQTRSLLHGTSVGVAGSPLPADDLDSLLEHLRKNNVQVVLGPRNRSDGVMQTYVFDPDMHLVEFVVYPPDHANR